MTHGIGPRWASGAQITVLDGVVLGHRDRNNRRQKRMRHQWRHGRDLVLEQYAAASGLTFNVREIASTRLSTTIDTPRDKQPFPPAGNILVGWVLHPTGGYASWKQEGQLQYTVSSVVAVHLGMEGEFCHEFGHAIGLGHDFNNVGCMDYEGLNNIELPGPHDIEALGELYG